MCVDCLIMTPCREGWLSLHRAQLTYKRILTWKNLPHHLRLTFALRPYSRKRYSKIGSTCHARELPRNALGLHRERDHHKWSWCAHLNLSNFEHSWLVWPFSHLLLQQPQPAFFPDPDCTRTSFWNLMTTSPPSLMSIIQFSILVLGRMSKGNSERRR